MKPEICPLFKKQAEFRKMEDFEGSQLYQCDDCKVQFWWPLNISPDKEFYQESGMYEFVGKRPPAWYHREFLEEPPLDSGRLLDVGFGQGEFLNAARNLNLDLWGIDIAERNIEMAKRNYNLQNIYAESLEDFANKESIEKFDILTAFELLEHLPDPASFLDLAKKTLKSQGYLVISTPNLDRFGGVKEDWDFPPNHLFRWNKNTLIKLLEAKNFKVIKIIEQPFTRDFFFIRGTLSFGLMRYLRAKSGKIIKKGIGPSNISDFRNESKAASVISQILELLAIIKNFLLNIITLPIEIFLKILGYKYWDLYIVAKSK